MQRLLLASGACVLFVLVLACGSTPVATVPAGPTVAVPADESALVAAAESFIDPYRKAENQLKKSAIRTDRKKALQAALPNLTVKNWIGTLAKTATTSDGKAYITVKLQGAKATAVKTWNNALSDTTAGTLIGQDSPLYKTISDMKNGQLVTFSGTFLTDDKDYLLEPSLTEAGSMTQPEFIFKFTDIAKK